MTRWTGRLVDRAQEQRYRSSRLPVLRRDVQVVAAAVLLHNAWSVVEAFQVAPTPGRASLDALSNVVMVLGGTAVVVLVRRTTSRRATATTVVVGTLVGDATPQVAVGVTLATAAVV